MIFPHVVGDKPEGNQIYVCVNMELLQYVTGLGVDWKATIDSIRHQHWNLASQFTAKARVEARQQVDCYKINNAHCFLPNCLLYRGRKPADIKNERLE